MKRRRSVFLEDPAWWIKCWFLTLLFGFIAAGLFKHGEFAPGLAFVGIAGFMLWILYGRGSLFPDDDEDRSA